MHDYKISRSKFNVVFVVLQGTDDSHPSNPSSSRRGESGMSYMYLAKILLAFLLIFVFGAIFTLFLENLPQLILYINSSL